MSQESDVCCTTSMNDIQNRCIPDEIDLLYFKTCIITHNINVIEQNINVSMFDIFSVKEPHTSRATSGGRRKDRNTSGQRGNKFNTSYREVLFVECCSPV